jgi:type III secretion system FlhB-like substrate exporter
VPEDPEMAAALQALAIEPEIPAALYRALVTTLDWASELDVRLRAH